ncbi:MAG: Uma2 family endonuclease [Myxococcales bacterium]|nr:Uma2 family endonuclease [Myxococcales bacterium]
MAERAPNDPAERDEIDESTLVTEDGAPVDNVFQEKQQRLLAGPLLDSWSASRPFVAMANVGLFFQVDEPPVVPDMLLSVDVTLPADLAPKKNRSYFVWRYGKPPDAVVEVVSNRAGRELDEKRALYERIRVAHYVVFDPFALLGDLRVRCFELTGERYVDRLDARLESLGLSLVEWDGAFEGHHDRWLRWADLDGVPIPTAAERAEKLAARLRQLGVNPEDV